MIASRCLSVNMTRRDTCTRETKVSSLQTPIVNAHKNENSHLNSPGLSAKLLATFSPFGPVSVSGAHAQHCYLLFIMIFM